MIKINLLSKETKAGAGQGEAVFSLAAKYLRWIIPLALSLLVITHICLAVLAGIRVGQLHKLNKKWEGLASQRKALEDFNKEHTGVFEDAKFLRQALAQRINWAEKLNSLSLYLPSGVWFREITVSSKALVINGSVVSLQKEEITLIKKFTDNLKNDSRFFRDFVSLELGTVQTRSIAGYDVYDFVLTGALRSQ